MAPAGAWLFTIAHRKLVDYQRRGFAEERARRRLAMERRPLAEEDTALIRALGEDVTLDRWKELPADQRTAIQARVLDERPYPEIASEAAHLRDRGAHARQPRPGVAARTTQEREMSEDFISGLHGRTSSRRWTATSGAVRADASRPGATRNC